MEQSDVFKEVVSRKIDEDKPPVKLFSMVEYLEEQKINFTAELKDKDEFDKAIENEDMIIVI